MTALPALAIVAGSFVLTGLMLGFAVWWNQRPSVAAKIDRRARASLMRLRCER